jgi:hypothetical protein
MLVAMAFDWNAVTALSTAASAAIIAVTVIVGVRQVRLTRIQLDNLRRATQLEGLMKIFDDLHNPTYLRARRFVATDLYKKLTDPAFRDEVALGIIWTKNPNEIHEELFVLRTFETIGSTVRHGLLDADVVLDAIAPSVIVSWEHLREVIEMQRAGMHPRMWENFEYLNTLASRWFADRGGRDRLTAWMSRVREPQE